MSVNLLTQAEIWDDTELVKLYEESRSGKFMDVTNDETSNKQRNVSFIVFVNFHYF